MILKKVLIITSVKSDDTDNEWVKREQYVREFYEALEAQLKNTSVFYTTYDDITCLVSDGVVEIVDTRHQLDLKDVQLVHFKNWMFDNEDVAMAAMIAFYLREHSVPFFNSEVDAGLAWGKISQMCRLAMGHIPVPNTFFAKKPQLIAVLEAAKLPIGFTFPLIMKADDGSKGNDNYLVQNASEAVKILKAVLDKQFVIQDYHPNDGDYRFLFIGLDELPLVFSRQATAGSHLNNTSKGGTGAFIDLHDVPPLYLDIARQAAMILRREIGGVDILVDKHTHEPYVLEVNSTPALATGFGVPTKVSKFADFVQQLLEQLEEE